MKVFLTAHEQSAFLQLPAAIRPMATVEPEVLSYQDNDKRREIRVRNMQLRHPTLLQLKERLTSASALKEVTALLATMDFSVLPEDDLAELYFAMGPNVVSQLLTNLLPNVRSKEDLEALVSLSLIRHSLLLSLSPTGVSL